MGAHTTWCVLRGARVSSALLKGTCCVLSFGGRAPSAASLLENCYGCEPADFFQSASRRSPPPVSVLCFVYVQAWDRWRFGTVLINIFSFLGTCCGWSQVSPPKDFWECKEFFARPPPPSPSRRCLVCLGLSQTLVREG